MLLLLARGAAGTVAARLYRTLQPFALAMPERSAAAAGLSRRRGDEVEERAGTSWDSARRALRGEESRSDGGVGLPVPASVR
jgi:hypothetical protein